MSDPDTDFVPTPDRATELTDAALDWLNSTFARTVALKLTPFLLPVIGALAVWLQNVIGINMNPAVATGFVVSVVIGSGVVITAYVHNHGKGAALLGTAALELEKLYEAGRGELLTAHTLTPITGHTGTLDTPAAPLGTTHTL